MASPDLPTQSVAPRLPTDSREALILEMAKREQRDRDDVVFDRFLPFEYRLAPRQYWSPLRVVAQAAHWLDELNIRSVIDIGSGVGKFCIAAALASRARFVGIEHRAELIGVARGITNMLELERRVRFVLGAFDEVTIPAAECYYFFNPFGESLFQREDHLDEEVEVSQARSLRDIEIAERLLRAAPPGTYVITYNGFGGNLPEDYQLLRSDTELPCPLRLAQKRRVRFR